MRTSAPFGAKTFEFFEIYGVSARKRGLSSADILRTREEGVNFLQFCRDVCYGRPLTTKEVFYDSNGSHNKEQIKTSRASK